MDINTAVKVSEVAKGFRYSESYFELFVSLCTPVKCLDVARIQPKSLIAITNRIFKHF